MSSTTSELVATTPRANAGAAEWALMRQQADLLAQSDIIPSAYRRKPANVLVAAMTGRHFGWDVLTAMRNGHVIEGTWGMKPEAMLGLVRRAGHSVTSTITPTGAVVCGTRADNGDVMTVGFSIDDAVQAGLVGLKDGKPHARSSSGKKLPWEQYPQTMCYWRAISLLCRFLFSDLTAGVHSTEELGGAIDDDGIDAPVEALAYLPLSDEALEGFVRACSDVELDPAEVFARAFPDGRPDPLTDEHLPAMRDAYKSILYERTAEAGIVDAEVVEADEPTPADEPEDRPASRAQVGKIKGEYHRLGINDRDAQLDSTIELVKRPIGSHNELTRIEAIMVIEELTAIADPAYVAGT